MKVQGLNSSFEMFGVLFQLQQSFMGFHGISPKTYKQIMNIRTTASKLSGHINPICQFIGREMSYI